jgi:hypothetical protein
MGIDESGFGQIEMKGSYNLSGPATARAQLLLFSLLLFHPKVKRQVDSITVTLLIENNNRHITSNKENSSN